MKNNQKPSPSKRKGRSAKLQEKDCNALNFNTRQAENLIKYKGYKEVFQGLGKYGVTFQEVEQRYFIVYLNFEKVLSIDINHQTQQATYCCFDNYFIDLLNGLIARHYSEEDILPILFNTILMRRKVVDCPVVKTTIPILYLRSKN